MGLEISLTYVCILVLTSCMTLQGGKNNTFSSTLLGSVFRALQIKLAKDKQDKWFITYDKEAFIKK